MNDTANPAGPQARSGAEVAAVSRARRYYCLLILTLVALMSTIDRHIMTILVEPIRQELELSDSQMGALTGVAFAFVYGVLCIPAARIADRWSRRKVIAIAITGYSVMTVLCGFARNFFELFLGRFGVGAGEACGNSSGHALVSDLFPRRERATAMTILLLSAPLGMGLGLGLGGWVLKEYGWRAAFAVAGVPGVILGALVLFTVPEIRKGMSDGLAAAPPPEPFSETLRALRATRAFPNIILATTLSALVTIGLSTWVPAFLARSHGMEHGAIGASLGAALGGGSLAGSLLGGPMIDWLGRRDLRLQLWAPMIATPVAAGMAALAFVGPVENVFLLLGVQAFLAALFSAPLIAILMSLAPVTARATASAMLGFVLNIVGLGLGPQIVGIASDALKPAFGDESLRIAMLCTTSIGLVAGFFYYLASRTYRDDIAAVDLRNRMAAAAA